MASVVTSSYTGRVRVAAETDRCDQIAGSTLVSDIDNKVFHDSFKRGRAQNTLMHGMIECHGQLQCLSRSNFGEIPGRPATHDHFIVMCVAVSRLFNCSSTFQAFASAGNKRTQGLEGLFRTRDSLPQHRVC